ncbi:hypothetical protein PMAYCL1PPCAC_26381 [Pristionchus mayeri]|uniref:Uncharacterized protein n=1 Tax=Pristionchus mayeri TaxID=1317129 RepID=A0AAN5D4E9_9BILA|nr:hypothetical protein PMAYCL1PPCAC_26381 [Pristionchus mayeri]
MYQLLVSLLAAVSQIFEKPDIVNTELTPIQDSSAFRDALGFPPLAREMPEFDDMLFGRMIVSNEDFPMLTPKATPEAAHVYPTAQQLDVIKAAAGGRRKFMQRALGYGAQLNGLIPDWMTEIGEFLKAEFSYEVLNSTVVDPGSLPFDKLNAGEYFSTVIVKDARAEHLLQSLYEKLRFFSNTSKPWIPAQALIKELDLCLDVDYGRSSNKDFMFDFKTGGKMVFYRVICAQKDEFSHYISLSVYDSDFKFHPIEHIETIAKGWRFLYWGSKKVEIHRWYEPRYITQKDWETLMNYMMSDFAVKLRYEYRECLDAAGIHVHDL